uniref:Uncharacterized protein n=1 Tax=Cacopsylla melanoneura TaxID=428564 RepID=A0A8D8Z164_9HEMI
MEKASRGRRKNRSVSNTNEELENLLEQLERTRTYRHYEQDSQETKQVDDKLLANRRRRQTSPGHEYSNEDILAEEKEGNHAGRKGIKTKAIDSILYGEL